MFADVHPSLDLRQAGGQAVIEAHVAADKPRALSWRLIVKTAGRGGVSSIAQSGNTDGATKTPLAIVSVNNPGAATLQVFDQGRLVGEVVRNIAQPPAR